MKTTSGWITFIAALGMMAGLMSSDIGHLKAWNDAASPSFFGVILGHFAAVITAFVGGVLIQPNRDGKFTRAADVQAALNAQSEEKKP